MAYFLMPLALLVKHYFPISNRYLSELPLYFFILLIIFHSVTKGKIYKDNFLSTKILVFLFFTIGFQSVASLNSYGIIGDSIYNSNPIKSILKFIVFLLFIFFHYFVVKILINDEKEIRLFLKGSLLSIILTLFITYSQFFYLLFPSSIFNNIASLLGKLFEARNIYRPEWYINGSYVQTMKRINGLFGEASLLAAHLSIICLPFVLAAIKNKYNIFNKNKKYNSLKYYCLLFSILLILLLAKTSTGIVAILIVLFFFFMIIPLKRKISFGIITLVLLLFFIHLYNTNFYVNSIIEDYVFGKTDSTSTDNRLGGTIGLLITFIQHPFFGVGDEYTNYYLSVNIPSWARSNAEFKDFATVRHSFPIMSVLLGWLAQYGIVVFTFFIVYVIKLQREMYRLIKKIDKSSQTYLFYKTIADSSLLFFFIFFGLSLLHFGWYESSYFIMFFFFVVFRHHLRKVVN
ncbi:O-antigen ligase family protein [Aeribacillus composti]